jgi:hypothetical protein
MTKRAAVWVVTLGLVALSGCSGDDDTNPGGGTPDSGGPDGTKADAGGGSETSTQPDVSTGSEAGPDGSSSEGSSPDGARSDGSSSEGGDGGLTPLQTRGKYLVDNVIACSDCHTPQTPTGPDLTHYLAGNPNFVAIPTGDGGVARLGSRNLTNDPTGLKNRTDDEIKNMFMNGLRPPATGAGDAGPTALNPIMPYYVFHNMTGADADAIVAYLRTVPGVNNEIPRRDPMFDVPGPANYINPANIPMPSTAPDASTHDSEMRGRYLAGQSGLCIECHTMHQSGPDAGAEVLTPGMYFAGGEDFSPFFAATLMIRPVSKNLTSDMATGLGSWTADDIVKVLLQGKAKDGTGICPPMPAGPRGAYGGLAPADALDIANYIKSLPAISHNVPDMCVFPPVPPDAGTSDSGHD